MSEAATVSDIVSMSIGGDAKEVKSAIGDVLQQKITVALENKKKEIVFLLSDFIVIRCASLHGSQYGHT